MSKYKININDIPRHSNYEGYVWLSNSKEADVYKNNKEIHLPTEESCNPFVAEANFIDTISQISYTIKFLDGVHHVYKFELKELENSEMISIEKKFLTAIKDVRFLNFKEFWKTVPDPDCEGFGVLQPAMTVFTGFQINIKEE